MKRQKYYTFRFWRWESKMWRRKQSILTAHGMVYSIHPQNRSRKRRNLLLECMVQSTHDYTVCVRLYLPLWKWCVCFVFNKTKSSVTLSRCNKTFTACLHINIGVKSNLLQTIIQIIPIQNPGSFFIFLFSHSSQLFA